MEGGGRNRENGVEENIGNSIAIGGSIGEKRKKKKRESLERALECPTCFKMYSTEANRYCGEENADYCGPPFKSLGPNCTNCCLCEVCVFENIDAGANGGKCSTCGGEAYMEEGAKKTPRVRRLKNEIHEEAYKLIKSREEYERLDRVVKTHLALKEKAKRDKRKRKR